MSKYPLQGDVIIIDAEPHAGRESGGHDVESGNIRRHMVVMSSDDYNRRTGLVLALPITTSDRASGSPAYYPILIPGGRNGVKGYVFLWQLQNYDYIARHGRVVNRISTNQYQDLLLNVKDMLDI
ncbi:type II toxin-antitoxin system PemK/MazF family toxin [Companilactobacillus ginsenosidimutans]|uniref:MazF family transcriptional regulator n=1 Tax=Companilactobacillus ginsenosidimutans TaxID=1007676 RepID=A0A0H4QH83_9LACO|nr:type II toxin-antitoxin system PemK/MazF family toxin [Companilactobacillus ginsenosidimutans]AKP67312.1 MazF family transcriptional regulator [Companilactobacillus ginsenosidimutans]